MQEVSMIQAGLHSAVLIAAASNIRVWGTHDEELVEVALGQKLKQHTDRLLLDHHAQQTHHVRVLQLRQHCDLLMWKHNKY